MEIIAQHSSGKFRVSKIGEGYHVQRAETAFAFGGMTFWFTIRLCKDKVDALRVFSHISTSKQDYLTAIKELDNEDSRSIKQ